MHPFLLVPIANAGIRADQVGAWSAVVYVSGRFGPEVPDDEGRWMEWANCRGVQADLFYPERGESTAPAKRVCHGCEVRLECLEYALVNGEKFGIWGGLSERERRRERQRRSRLRRYG